MLEQVTSADHGYNAAPEHLEIAPIVAGQATTGTVVPGSALTPDDLPTQYAINARYWASADGMIVAWGWMSCTNGVFAVNVFDRHGGGSTLTVNEPCQSGDSLLDVRLSDDGSTLFFSTLTQAGAAMYEQGL